MNYLNFLLRCGYFSCALIVSIHTIIKCIYVCSIYYQFTLITWSLNFSKIKYSKDYQMVPCLFDGLSIGLVYISRMSCSDLLTLIAWIYNGLCIGLKIPYYYYSFEIFYWNTSSLYLYIIIFSYQYSFLKEIHEIIKVVKE